MAKLVQFMENRPSENALLCKIILKLLEVPGADEAFKKTQKVTPQAKLRAMFEDKKKQSEPYESVPLDQLQWWLYILEFEGHVKQEFSPQQRLAIQKFNAGM